MLDISLLRFLTLFHIPLLLLHGHLRSSVLLHPPDILRQFIMPLLQLP